VELAPPASVALEAAAPPAAAGAAAAEAPKDNAPAQAALPVMRLDIPTLVAVAMIQV